MENLAEIEQRIEGRVKNILSRRKVRYHLAKKLGLTSEMAGIACGWSEARIRALADEYQARETQEPVPVA